MAEALETSLEASPMAMASSAASAADTMSLHHAGRCKPCAFYHTKGCQSGVDCLFCHECPPSELQRRKRLRRTILMHYLSNGGDGGHRAAGGSASKLSGHSRQGSGASCASTAAPCSTRSGNGGLSHSRGSSASSAADCQGSWPSSYELMGLLMPPQSASSSPQAVAPPQVQESGSIAVGEPPIASQAVASDTNLMCNNAVDQASLAGCAALQTMMSPNGRWQQPQQQQQFQQQQHQHYEQHQGRCQGSWGPMLPASCDMQSNFPMMQPPAQSYGCMQPGCGPVQYMLVPVAMSMPQQGQQQYPSEMGMPMQYAAMPNQFGYMNA